MKRQFEQRVAKAAKWLRSYQPDSTEERAFQVLGLCWAGADSSDCIEFAGKLRAQQREDGGWAQLPTLSSDSYATGLVLYALHTVGGVATSEEVYQRGVKFLLQDQLSDGSWATRSRASPVQVAIDDIFPNGKDQWISSAATSWASIALMLPQERRP